MTETVSRSAVTAARPLDADWWRGAVIYQVYPRSFQDSDNNGIGDLPGITSRLPYLADLGVDAIWISPFFASPMKDFGYDVSDYRAVDPIFGTLADFDRLIAEAHRLGLRVIIDQVLNHTSDRHPWFLESRSGRHKAKSDWYVWADARPDGSPPNNWLSVFSGPAWTWDTSRCQYYLHNFLPEQPDLNFHNPEVQDAILAEMAFWLDRGVDGFRLDTVNFYFHSAGLEDNPPVAERIYGRMPDINPYNFQDHLYDKSRPENLAFLQRIRALCERYPGTTTLGEVGDHARSLELMAQYTSGGDKLHMCYTFDFLGPVFDRDYVRRRLEAFDAMGGDGWPCWAFSNHDVARHATRWAQSGDTDTIARLAAAVLSALRGSVCLYQGEELGLTEAELRFEDLVDPYGIRLWPVFKGRDGSRTPMVWEAESLHGGFSPVKPWLPVADNHLQRAAGVQSRDEGSILAHYRRLLALRRAHPALVKGALHFRDCAPHLLAIIREDEAERLVCVFNFGPDEEWFGLWPGETVEPLEGGGAPGASVAEDGRTIRVPPKGWFFGRVG